MVCLICDGYDAIGQDFKDRATKYGFFDQAKLESRGFMKKNDRTGKMTMKTMPELMPTLSDEEIPTNMLHCFQACTWDFGFGKEDQLKGKRINFIFGLKQRNDGKINSHKWFF